MEEKNLQQLNDQFQQIQEWFDNTVKLTANHHALFLGVFELLEKDCGVPRSRILETIDVLRLQLEERGYGGSTAQNLVDLLKSEPPGSK